MSFSFTRRRVKICRAGRDSRSFSRCYLYMSLRATAVVQLDSENLFRWVLYVRIKMMLRDLRQSVPEPGDKNGMQTSSRQIFTNCALSAGRSNVADETAATDCEINCCCNNRLLIYSLSNCWFWDPASLSNATLWSVCVALRLTEDQNNNDDNYVFLSTTC